jgi:hypothetical protein
VFPQVTAFYVPGSIPGSSSQYLQVRGVIQIKFGQDGGVADVDVDVDVLGRGEQGPRMPDEARAKTFFGNDVTTSNGPNTGPVVTNRPTCARVEL